MKPLQLTSAIKDEFNPDTASYPLMGFRKVDGVRAGHLHGFFHGRSLDPFKNTALNEKFNGTEYAGFDGELTVGGCLNDAELRAAFDLGTVVAEDDTSSICSLTTGLTNRSKLKKGESELPANAVWNLFDYLGPDAIELEYLERYNMLTLRVECEQPANATVLPFVWINNADEARAWIIECLELEYEGAIFRNPKAKHKSGRATASLNDFWRYKPVSDKDAIVTGCYEAEQNNNEATTNSRGRTERSSHQENKVGKGILGGFLALDVATGRPVRIPAGRMSQKERAEVWAAWLADPASVAGRPFKYTSLDVGVKDEPRQARWICWRAAEDMEKAA